MLIFISDPGIFAENICKGVLVSDFMREYMNPKSEFKFALVPFTSYKVHKFRIDITTCFHGEEAKQFWNTIGPLMTYLHFQQCYFTTMHDSYFATFLLQKVSNVKHLVLTKVKIDTAVHGKAIGLRFDRKNLSLETLTVKGYFPAELTFTLDHANKLKVRKNI